MPTAKKNKVEEKLEGRLEQIEQTFQELTSRETALEAELEQVKNAKQQTIGQWNLVQELTGETQPPLDLPKDEEE